MKAKVVLGIILAATLILVPAAYLGAQALRPPAITQSDIKTITLNADTIFALVNQERTQRGLKPLVRDARLDATAQARADDMVARNYFSHFDPITGENLVKIKPTNPQCSSASENIGTNAGHYDDNISQLDGWMNSKPHRDAILRADYTLTGVAVSGTKVVQHFCIAK